MNKHEKHRQEHPQDEGIRKERQRSKERLMLFHIKRQHIAGIPLPASIDTDSAIYARVLDQYNRESTERTVVEYG